MTSAFQQHLIDRTARRCHRHYISFFLHTSFEQERSVSRYHLVNRFCQLLAGHYPACRNIICRSNLHIIRIHHRSKRITTIEEHRLPLTNIAQEVIVQQNHLHRSLLFHDGTQFLQVHLQAAVSHEYAYRAVRTSKSGTDSCRKAEAHSTPGHRK